MDLSRKKTFYRSKPTRVLIVLEFQVDRSDRSPTGQTGRCCQTGYTVQTGQTARRHRSDQCVRLVPVLIINNRRQASIGRTGWSIRIPQPPPATVYYVTWPGRARPGRQLVHDPPPLSACGSARTTGNPGTSARGDRAGELGCRVTVGVGPDPPTCRRAPPPRKAWPAAHDTAWSPGARDIFASLRFRAPRWW